MSDQIKPKLERNFAFELMLPVFASLKPCPSVMHQSFIQILLEEGTNTVLFCSLDQSHIQA